MKIDSFEMVFLTLAFIVPGFVYFSVKGLFFPNDTAKPHTLFLKFLSVSCLNYGGWSWLIYLIHTSDSITNHAWLVAMIWGGIIFLSPAIAGIVIGILSLKEIPRMIAHRFGINLIHSIQTAWDFKFHKTGPVWVVLTLKDGRTIAGLYGPHSFASESEDRGIYLEKTYTLGENGAAWEPVDQSAGVLVSGDQIAVIEFRHFLKEPNNVKG